MSEASREPIWLWRELADGLPALLHPGRAQAWWWLGERAAWHDGERLFVEVGPRIACVEVGATVQVLATDGGLVAWGQRLGLIIQGERVIIEDSRRIRRGAEWIARRPAGRLEWRVQGVALPFGAARSADLRPFPSGRGVIWTSEGFLYRMTDGRPVEALARAGRWWAGPQGAVAVGHGEEAWRAAAPGRPMLQLPSPLSEPLRWLEEGRWIAGVDRDGWGVQVDLHTGRTRQLDALPVGPHAWLHPDGRLVAKGVLQRAGLREASFALSGERLAGPGGFVWDLGRGVRLGSGAVGPVQLGATVPAGEGFATVDWESGEGLWIDGVGAVTGRFTLPLDADDLIIGGQAGADGPVFETALGRGFRVGSRGPEPVKPPRIRRSGRPRGWEFGEIEAEAVIGERRWGWNLDGLLIARRR